MDWMTTHSIEKIENIKPPQASELILELGLDHFLSEPQKCTLMDDKYGTSDSNGWNNGNVIFYGPYFACNMFMYFLIFIYSTG